MTIPQLVNPGEVREEKLLPSFLYIPGANGVSGGNVGRAVGENPRFVTGRLAQKRGVENAGRASRFGEILVVPCRSGSHRADSARERARRVVPLSPGRSFGGVPAASGTCLEHPPPGNAVRGTGSFGYGSRVL